MTRQAMHNWNLPKPRPRQTASHAMSRLDTAIEWFFETAAQTVAWVVVFFLAIGVLGIASLPILAVASLLKGM